MDMAIFEDGRRFFVGCNYWASHAGTNMWRDWSAESVEADFKALSENGVQVLRVFPRWDDFQPLTPHLGGGSSFVELRMGEDPLPDTEFGRAGVNETMMERFRVFLNLAEKYNLKLLVGIITGWMSGRMLKPQAFERVNVLADPFAIRWEVRFTRLFVKTFKDSKAIVGWDLGNECNCMAGSDIHQFWAWTNAIAGAIRLEDPTRPVVSGMHGLKTDPMQHVPIVDQAELTDVLCTHPYPVFTPHSKVDRVNTIRNAFHAAAETRLYEEIGGKPAFVEEAGSLGPGASSETVAAHYLENMLWNSFAHGCRGLLWWCGHDQTALTHTPYDWVGMERHLGLLQRDRSPKDVMKVLGAFGRMAADVQLPKHRQDAVCLLTEEQDQWGVAYMTFILAKQAGFDIEFQYANEPLKKADVYLMPSIRGYRILRSYRWRRLLEAVADGAKLYVSSDDATLDPFFDETAGIRLETSAKAAAPQQINCDRFKIQIHGAYELKLSTIGAEVLATDADGDPALTCNQYGKGKIVFCNAPVESSLTEQPRAFDGDLHLFYRYLMELLGIKRAVTRKNPMLTLTEHSTADGGLLVCAVNNTPSPLTDTLSAPGRTFAGTVCGAPQTSLDITLPGNTGTVIRLE